LKANNKRAYAFAVSRRMKVEAEHNGKIYISYKYQLKNHEGSLHEDGEWFKEKVLVSSDGS
jgi:hypothetical protein